MKPVIMEQLLESYLKHRFPSEAAEGKILPHSLEVYAQSGDEADGPCKSSNEINLIAAKLVRMADDFQKKHEAQVGGRRDSENIQKDNNPQSSLSMTNIASSLSGSLNPDNFKLALQSVCSHATSLPLEAALALELTAHVYRFIDFRNGDFIPSTIAQYFGSRIKNLENIDPEKEV